MAGRTLLQFFHWYYPDGGKLWSEVAEKADRQAGEKKDEQGFFHISGRFPLYRSIEP